MLKILALLIPFIREHFFSRKEEMDFRNKNFNPVKWYQYIAFIILFVMILFVGGRLFTISIKYAKLKIDHTTLKKELSEQRDIIHKFEVRNSLLKEENDSLHLNCFGFDHKQTKPKNQTKG